MNRFLLANMKMLPRRQMCPTIITLPLSRYLLFSFCILSFFIVGIIASADAQSSSQPDTGYRKTVMERSAKIVNSLGITEQAKFAKVQNTIADQYMALASLQDEYAGAAATAKSKTTDKEQLTTALRLLDDKKAASKMQLHNRFISQLNSQLTPDQTDKVKDGMTYGVFPLTYAAYLDELPSLTAEQKSKIYDWLKEARELAMDGESSDKKHAVFGKYKGRINNYLSAAGYDLKKEGEEWTKRRQAAQQTKQTQN